MIILALNATPPQDWDLYRHYLYLDEIKRSGISLWDFLFNNGSGIGNPDYKYMLSFNILRWFFSKSGYYSLLPAIVIGIDYSIVSYIIMDHAKYEIGNIKVLSILLCFTLMPFLFTLSGLRNGIAACIEALAVYLYLYKNKRSHILILLSFIAITFHYAAFLAVPFAIISKRRFSYTWSVIILFSSLILNILANKMIGWDNDLLNNIAGIYLSYSSATQFWGSNTVLYGVLTIIFLVVIRLFNIKNKRHSIINTDNSLFLSNFIVYYSLFIIANLGNYDMVLRPAYILGAMSPVIVSYVTPPHKHVTVSRLLSWWMVPVISVICIVLNYIFITSVVLAFV